jgi:glutamate mutase epsilon subunit
MLAHDAAAYLWILEPGAVPFPCDVMEVHEAQLRRRAEAQGIDYAELAVRSVFELSERLERLMP